MKPKDCRLIFFGGREYTDYECACREMVIWVKRFGKENLEIVSGCCDDAINGKLTFVRLDWTKVYGADGLGERWAHENEVPVVYCPADWTTHKRSAGPIRNQEMAGYGSHYLGFWNGKSKGTRDMFEKAVQALLRGIIVPYK